LRSEEQGAIEAAAHRLMQIKESDRTSAIRDATLALDRATQRLAELMMDAAVTGAIRGKTMSSAAQELEEDLTAPHPMAPAEFK